MFFRIGDHNVTSSPGRSYSTDLQESRVTLTRIEYDDKIKQNLSPYYSNGSNIKPKSDQTITHSYSPQRSSTKPEPRLSTASYGLRNPYDFQNDEPVATRHEHKATPYRTSTVSSGETFPISANRFNPKPLDKPSILTRTDYNEIRSRIFSNTNEEKEIPVSKDVTPKKITSSNQLDMKKSSNDQKVDVANKSKYFLIKFS